MPSPSRLETYPAWLIDLAQSFKRGGHSSYHFDQYPEAQRYRRQVYNLQGAISRSRELLLDMGEFLAARTRITVEKDGFRLYIEHVEDLYPEPKSGN